MRARLWVVALFAYLPDLALAADSDVKVSSVGYLAARVKRASITAPATSFSVKRDGDGSVVFTGTPAAAKTDPDTQQSIAVADFSSVTEAGRYYVDVPGVGRSVSFPIGNDVYRDAFIATMLGFYGLRCNTAVSFAYGEQTYSHGACHMDDAHLDYVGSAGGKRESLKGWHDAGDYGKYTVNAGITVGSLLAAWEEYGRAIATYSWPIPETGGALPDFLDEIRWELEWLLTMQYGATDGRVSHKLTSLTFDAPHDGGGTAEEHWVMPEKDLQTRYFVPWGSAATADFVAMLAKAARVYRSYDAAFADTCLSAAKVSYAHIRANTANQSVTDPTSTGGYATSDSDDRLWAAAEMWETTGDTAALSDFETRAATFSRAYVDTDFDWGNVKNLGMFVYLGSQRSGRNNTLVSAIKQSLTTAADTLVTNRNTSGYGRALSGKSGNYYWGSNGSVARTCMLLQLANRLGPKTDYLDTCVDQISWIFGRNYYNRSQVTGVGLDPPLNPHHRPSVADSIAKPWPGLLVGGGNSTSTQAPGGNKNGATNWTDKVEAYELNEVAINWNAPLTYALAAFLAGAGSSLVDAGAMTPDAGADSKGDVDALPNPDAAPVADATTSPDQSRPADATSTLPDAVPGPDAQAVADAAPRADAPPRADADAGSTAGGSKASGCSCSTVGAPPPALPLVVLVAVIGLGLERRVRRR